LRASSPDTPVRVSSAVSTPWAMSGDCGSIVVTTPQVLPSKPMLPLSKPMPLIVSRTIFGIST
jgi:hypothetical protein